MLYNRSALTFCERLRPFLVTVVWSQFANDSRVPMCVCISVNAGAGTFSEVLEVVQNFRSHPKIVGIIRATEPTNIVRHHTKFGGHGSLLPGVCVLLSRDLIWQLFGTVRIVRSLQFGPSSVHSVLDYLADTSSC